MSLHNIKTIKNWSFYIWDSIAIYNFLYETDRSTIIIGCAKLEEQLEKLLKYKLLSLPTPQKRRNLFDTNEPLSTFDAKINISYSIRIIDQEDFELLHKLRQLRNVFAHDFDYRDFDSINNGVYFKNNKQIKNDRKRLNDVIKLYDKFYVVSEVGVELKKISRLKIFQRNL